MSKTEDTYSTLQIDESKYLELPHNDQDEEYKVCAICQDEIKDICLLRCNHVLCLNCIVKWMKENKSCPFCRLDLSDIEFEQETNNNNTNDFTNCNKVEKVLCYTSLVSWFLFFVYNFSII